MNGVVSTHNNFEINNQFLTEGRGISMSYIDGYVLAVPTANRAAYQKIAEDAVTVFKEYGALKLVECWGDDVPDGKLTSFPLSRMVSKLLTFSTNAVNILMSYWVKPVELD
jgi:hypothetical protein